MPPRNDTTKFAIRLATTEDVPALRRLVALCRVPLFCGPALVAEIDGNLGAAVSLADGLAVADSSESASAAKRLLRARRDALLAPS
jgi:hypothetical protein